MLSGRRRDIPQHGCITREEISIIMNTGLITARMRERAEVE